MTTTIYLHGPHHFEARLAEGSTVFAVVYTGDASLFLYTQEDCDALIAAGFTAKSLLNGDHTVYPEQPPPDAGDSDS